MGGDGPVEERMDTGFPMKWFRDPQPPGGAPEPKKIELPESAWDSTKWKETILQDYDYIAKGKAKSLYLLNDKDLLPLWYHKQVNSRGYNNLKMYKRQEVERLAWIKYGGPSGLKAAKKIKKSGAKLAIGTKSSTTSPRKEKSSSSQAVGAKKALLGEVIEL